jgi:hypothetical protein
MTATQASEPIWQKLAASGGKPLDIPIERFDVSVPESMALALAKLWRTMLQRTAMAPTMSSVSVDQSTELFSAKVAAREIVAKLDKNPANKNNLELLEIANSMLEYFNYPASERPERAEQIRKRALALVQRLNAPH